MTTDSFRERMSGRSGFAGVIARKGCRIDRSARWVIAAAAFALTLYAATPFCTLVQLAEALRCGDAAMLRHLIDWDGVREGIKEDLCDQVSDTDEFLSPAAPKTSAATLPAFGAGFVRGIASHAIDDLITADHLAQIMGMSEVGSGCGRLLLSLDVVRLFFASPTRFSITVRCSGGSAPITAQLLLQHGKWRVNRVWLPPEWLVTTVGQRT